MLEIHLRIIYQHPIVQVSRSIRNHRENRPVMQHPDFKPDNAKSDDRELKDEIQAISGRINHILKEVKQHYCLAESDAQPETADTATAETTVCHPNPTPDQEA